LLIGWDAADWEIILPLMRAGQMPALLDLYQRGAHGNLTTLTPILSPLLWTSIATGKRADKHGILGFTEPDPISGGIRPVCSTSRTCKAIWNILTQEGLRTHLVGWFASHPVEPITGINVADVFTRPSSCGLRPGPLPPGSVHPPSLEQTLAELRVYPTELLVQQMATLLPRLSEIPKEDRRPGEVAVALAECLTIDRVTTWILEHEDWDFLAVYCNAIDHVGHHFMPFHPPRREGISNEDFHHYQDVVTNTYRLLDTLLGRLLNHCDSDTAVLLVSDHGFYCDHRRPPPSRSSELKNARLWHRPLGVICAAGPPFKQKELLHGSGILDITPTILTLLGLPVGEDMDGHVLQSALAATAEPAFIPSWDTKPGRAAMHPPGFQENAWEKREVLQQLADLGYISLGQDEQAMLRGIDIERTFHLAVHYLDTGRPAEASGRFEQLLGQDPDNADFKLYLARCRFMMGEMAACRQGLTELLERTLDSTHALMLLGEVCSAEGQNETALELFQRAQRLNPDLPTLDWTIGRTYIRLKRWSEAESALRRALEVDRDSAQAHLGMAYVFMYQERLRDALAAAQRVLELNYHLSEAHYLRGVALARLSEVPAALWSFEKCLELNPQSAGAHQWLAKLHEIGTGDQEKAALHQRKWEELLKGSHPSQPN
jgi:tetratricopeptide (TPR) repeat protein